MRSSEEKEEIGMKLTNYEWLCSAGRWAMRKPMVLILMTVMLWLAPMKGAGAAVSTTTVQGTVYLANGEPGSGMLHVSWPAFMSANGQAIVADSVDVTIGQDGFLSVKLAPNQGAIPAGLFYTATFYMNDGSVSTQYWVVPGAAQATLAQVQAQVMPAAQAVQVLDRNYVDQAIAQVSESMLAGSGGTLTGPLYLNSDPTQPLQAADKHYVDLAVSQAPSSSVNPATAGQVAVYAGNGTSISGLSTVPVTAGGTGSVTAADALEALGGISSNKNSAQALAGPLNLSGSYDSNIANLNQAATAQNVQNVAPRSVKEFGAKGDGIFSDFRVVAGSNIVELADVCCGYNFTAGDVGKLISLPGADSDHKTLYTTISGFIDYLHVTIASLPTYSFDSGGTFANQAMWMTDDLAAINAAIVGITNGREPGTGSTREGGGAIIFPCGYYGLSGQLILPGNIRVEGVSRGCSILMYMGTASVDATVEARPPGPAGNWLHQGYYLTTENHSELGPACTGAACSPSVTEYILGVVKNLTIYGSKNSNWAFSVIYPSGFLAEDIVMHGGNKGCFYHIDDVQTTWTHMGCQKDLTFGNGFPITGIYSDGTGTGQGIVPMKIQSPLVMGATGDALAFNFTGISTVSDAQISVSHRALNITNSGGINFQNTLLEGGEAGEIADHIGCNGCTFNNVVFGVGKGLDIVGAGNTFVGGTVIDGQISISGENNQFFGMNIPTGVTIDDHAQTTRIVNSWAGNVGPAYDRPQDQTSAKTIVGTDPVVFVNGVWNNAGTYPLATTKMTNGTAWRAIFIGNWFSSSVVASMPPYVELTDVANTVVMGANTLTFSITGGLFQVTQTPGDYWVGFNGFVYIIPRQTSPGEGGANSMKLAGNMQVLSVQIGSGTAMSGNHGTGTRVQHSDGSGAPGGIAVYAADGSVTAGPIAPTGAVVGTSDAQTLSNKSIAGSEINTGTIGVAYGGTGQNESTATGIGQFSAGNYSVSTALANGTAATTQSAGDNSTKLATTSYVASPGTITPTVVTASGLVTGGNDTTRTTAATIGTTAFSTTGLVLPTVPANTTKNGRCVVLWQVSTTSYTTTFGLGMSNAPTGLWGGTSVTYNAAGTSNWLGFSQTATAATAVSTAVTAGAANTTYRTEIDFTLQTGVTNPVAVTVFGLVSQSSATLTIQPGSACYWLP
jgi:hypothetical protein